jgi:hypothetical protein
MRWVGHTAHTGEVTNAYKILVENLKARPMHRWEGNITMNLREMGWEDAD